MSNLSVTEKKFSRVDNLMWKVSKLLARKKRMILDEFGLTCSQYDILVAIDQLSKNKEEVIQVNLAEKAQIDPMTTSTVLRNLQKRGLAKRERGLVNTRTVEVELTQSGKELYFLAQQKLENMKQEIYQNLDQQQFTDQLLILSDELNKLNY